VFAFLIVPATCAALLTASVVGRLAVGWMVGAVVSALGLAAAYAWDLPTGATVVTTFGAVLGALAVILAVGELVRRARVHGVQALAGVGVATSIGVATAGAFLIAVPAGDHLWLDWLEARLPVVELMFLTPTERRTYHDTHDALDRSETELARLRSVRRDVEWGTRRMDDAQAERLRQFLAGRVEIAAGDRMVLLTLRRHARERQRLWLGVPLLVVGTLGVAIPLARRRRLLAGAESTASAAPVPRT
jgi:zinc/manganese transport system permease protein